MSRIRYTLTMLALAIAGLTGCQPDTAIPTPIPAAPVAVTVPALPARAGLAPDRVAHGFYAWYVAATEASFSSGGPSVYDDGSLEEGDYLAPALLQDIRAQREAISGAPGGADMVLCAQDVPETVEATLESEQGDTAAVVMTSDLIGHRWRLEMERDAGGWRIADIDCRAEERVAAPTPTPFTPLGGKDYPTGQAATPAAEETAEPVETTEPVTDSEGWVVYDNADYAIELRYPEDWTHQEHVNQPDQLPIGPEALEMLVMLMPQAWADAMAARPGPPDPDAPAIAPFTVEILRGDEATLRLDYPQPERAAAIGLGGGPATREVVELSETLYQIRYVVQHPQDPELWVVITDSITGFPDRVVGNEETLAIFSEVLETLKLY